MDRQKVFKNYLNNNIKMDTTNIMNIEKFFKKIEKENNDNAFYRYINVSIDKDGKKKTFW